MYPMIGAKMVTANGVIPTMTPVTKMDAPLPFACNIHVVGINYIIAVMRIRLCDSTSLVNN